MSFEENLLIKEKEKIKPAGFFVRLIAIAIDNIILSLIIYTIIYFGFGVEHTFIGVDGIKHTKIYAPLWFYALSFFSLIILWVHWEGKSPGKEIMAIHIVDNKTLKNISYKQAILRNIGYIISALPLFLGFLWAGIDKNKRALHDYISGTIVVYETKPENKF